MVSFLKTEREQAGWRFLLLWLIASSIGFSIGLSLEMLIFGQPNLYIAVSLAALGQAYVINRHISIYLPWAVGTAIFWIIGLAIGSQIISLIITLPDNLTLIQQLSYLAAVSALGGLLGGIPQLFFMRDWLPKMGLWWLIVSAISWAVIFLPGVIIGFVLLKHITDEKVLMEGRHYELSGEY